MRGARISPSWVSEYRLVVLGAIHAGLTLLFIISAGEDRSHHKQVEEIQKRLLEAKLREQKQQSEDDARWLHAEEQAMRPPQSPTHDITASNMSGQSSVSTYRRKDSQSSVASNDSTDSSPYSQPRRVLKSQASIELDRSNDDIYTSTTATVRAVMDMTRGVQASKSDLYVELVKCIGLKLKTLLSSVDEAMPSLPEHYHHEVG